MRHNDFSSEITGRGHRFLNALAQMMNVSASFVRYEIKMSRQENYCTALCGATCVVRKQESAEAIVAQLRE